jgi:hypothetical protein
MPAEVLKDSLDAIKGRLAIDGPLFTIELTSEWLKVPRLLKVSNTVGEYQGTRLEVRISVIGRLC